MSLTAPGIKGVVTDFMGATPSATVAFQVVSTPSSTILTFPEIRPDIFLKSSKALLK